MTDRQIFRLNRHSFVLFRGESVKLCERRHSLAKSNRSSRRKVFSTSKKEEKRKDLNKIWKSAEEERFESLSDERLKSERCRMKKRREKLFFLFPFSRWIRSPIWRFHFLKSIEENGKAAHFRSFQVQWQQKIKFSTMFSAFFRSSVCSSGFWRILWWFLFSFGEKDKAAFFLRFRFPKFRQKKKIFLSIFSNKKFRQGQNYFLINLSVADLGLLVTNNTMFGFASFRRQWIFGEFGKICLTKNDEANFEQVFFCFVWIRLSFLRVLRRFFRFDFDQYDLGDFSSPFDGHRLSAEHNSIVDEFRTEFVRFSPRKTDRSRKISLVFKNRWFSAGFTRWFGFFRRCAVGTVLPSMLLELRAHSIIHLESWKIVCLRSFYWLAAFYPHYVWLYFLMSSFWKK